MSETRVLDAPSRQPDAAARSFPADPRSRLSTILVAIWLVIAGSFLAWGLEYYRTPLEERPFTALHELLASTGIVGHSLGIVGSLMMLIGVSMYSIRKRVRVLDGLGRMSTWLQVHIFLCTLGPFLVLLHTSFRIGGLVSIAFWSMALVVTSGVFGRYVYARIPRTVQGQFRTRGAIEARRVELIDSIAAVTGLAQARLRELAPVLQPPRSARAALLASIRWDLAARRRGRRLSAVLRDSGVPAAQQRALRDVLHEHERVSQQLALLQPFQRLFRYWHVFHLPLAILMFAILIVHVVVAAMFGYGLPF